jgi:hypothetical protein
MPYIAPMQQKAKNKARGWLLSLFIVFQGGKLFKKNYHTIIFIGVAIN